MNDEPQHKHRKYYILALFAVFIAILGIILPVTEFTEPQYINASNITNYSVIWASGSLSNINDIDNLYIQFNETSAPFYIDVNYTNITHFSYIEVKAMYFSLLGTPNQHEIEVEVWCVAEQDFVDVTDLVVSPDETYFTRRFPDSMHFINPNGNVTIRFNHTSNGNTNHRLKLNTVRLINQSQYSQITTTVNNYYNTTTGTGSQNLSQVLAVGNDAKNQNITNVSEFKNYGNGGTAINFTVNRSYTGTANMITRFAQSSSNITFLVTGNDLTGGHNFRVNMNPDQSQQDPTKAGWALVLKPFDSFVESAVQINRAIPGTTTLEAVFQINSNSTFWIPQQNETLRVQNLSISGTGNWSIVMADSNGVLKAFPMNGSGAHYGCFATNGSPYPGTPGC